MVRAQVDMDPGLIFDYCGYFFGAILHPQTISSDNIVKGGNDQSFG